MSIVEDFVSRLEKVIRTGSNKYMAVCPAHEDKSPSLAITEAQDGRILIHCFAGCGTLDVVESVGMELSDLFPPDSSVDINVYRKPVLRTREQKATADEWFIELCDAAIKRKERLSSEERTRYLNIKQQI